MALCIYIHLSGNVTGLLQVFGEGERYGADK